MRYQCAQRGCIVEAEAQPETCPTCGNPFVPVVDETLPRERAAPPPAVAAAAAAVVAELELEARIDALTRKAAELEQALANQAQALELQVSLAERRNGELDELTRKVEQALALQNEVAELRASELDELKRRVGVLEAVVEDSPAPDEPPLAALDATGG
jgi:predicted  nucleic acid-binding Zn-ribbon protein